MFSMLDAMIGRSTQSEVPAKVITNNYVSYILTWRLLWILAYLNSST
jgi:hypothetical protein